MRAGLNKDSFRPTDELFSTKTGPPIYAATMSRSRFRFIKEVLRFDDIDTRDERKTPENQGKLAPISKIFDLFLDACSVNFSPGRDLTVDESIVAFKGRCSFKIFMPSKPDRYGIKIWSMVDSKTSYLWNAEIYQGKTSNKRETGQAERVVKQLVKGRGEQTIEHTGRTITAGNFFTSVKLAKDLLNAGVSFLGTLRKTNQRYPSAFKRRWKESHIQLSLVFLNKRG